MVEILPHPSGLTRNIVQCFQDFSIPLYLSHAVTQIFGRERVEAVEIAPLENGVPSSKKAILIECDTVLLSVGLIPENELSRKAGVLINPDTNGPLVGYNFQSNIAGIFACGNVLHIHDLVDFVTDEAQQCGKYVVDYLHNNAVCPAGIPVAAGANVKYVVPNSYAPETTQLFNIRSLIVKKNAELIVEQGGHTIYTRKLRCVQPAEMISNQSVSAKYCQTRNFCSVDILLEIGTYGIYLYCLSERMRPRC